MKTQFFHFSQNNSGGYFVTDNDHGICENVIIEAESATAAWDKLQRIGDNVSGFNVYCGCCGERWYHSFDDEGTDKPMIFNESVYELTSGWCRTRAFIHYQDKPFEEVKFKS